MTDSTSGLSVQQLLHTWYITKLLYFSRHYSCSRICTRSPLHTYIFPPLPMFPPVLVLNIVLMSYLQATSFSWSSRALSRHNLAQSSMAPSRQVFFHWQLPLYRAPTRLGEKMICFREVLAAKEPTVGRKARGVHRFQHLVPVTVNKLGFSFCMVAPQ